MSSVCVLDYGSGNIRSVFNLFSTICDKVVVSNEPGAVRDASHIVLPGVGAFGAAMRKIRDRVPVDVVKDELEAGKPFLGICVGMQVLADQGTEFGEHQGLGWIPGTVRQLDPGNLPLPHVGWNSIDVHKTHPLLEGLQDAADFYYVHSFAFQTSEPEAVLATTDFGETFTAVVARDNIFGVQFHPEKSQKAGSRLARNFIGFS